MRSGGSFPICLSDDNLYTDALGVSVEPRIHETFRWQRDLKQTVVVQNVLMKWVLEVLYGIGEQFRKSHPLFCLKSAEKKC